MLRYSNNGDTIFALASGVGKAPVAVFRISGPSSGAVLSALSPNTEFPARCAVLRTLHHPKSLEPLDRALITRFEAPRSFTGEEVVEISVTGGRAVTLAVVRALELIPGLRPAEAGEFAWRAFVNGKLDLTEVEGLADLVDAETEAQRRQAHRIVGGILRRECEGIRTLLLTAMSIVEAQIDFSDVQDVEELTMGAARHAASAAASRIDRALITAPAGERLRDGFVVVIAGPPNAGKSTLMNAMAGRDVAITSPFEGTTRDPIEIFLDLRGFPVTLVDTAGIRDTTDPIEKEGIARSLQRANAADLTLWLNDSCPVRAGSPEGPSLFVRTKIDRLPALEPADWDFAISAKTGEGIELLLGSIADIAIDGMSGSEPAILTLERHRRAFQDAKGALSSVLAAGVADTELIAEELRRAAASMERVVGSIGVEDVLGEIFSRLCIGK